MDDHTEYVSTHVGICNVKVERKHSGSVIVDLLGIVESTESMHCPCEVGIHDLHIHRSIEGAVIVGLVQHNVSLECGI